MDIPLQEREIWVNQEGIPLDERDFDSDESSFALPDRIFIVTTASTPLVQVTTQLPDQLNHDQLFQLNCFFYFTVLATLIGIIMHYHFTRDNGSMNIILADQEYPDQRFLIMEDVFNDGPVEQDEPATPIDQMPGENKSIIRILTQLHLQRFAYYASLILLFGWTVYYGISGVEDAYTRRVCFYTFLAYCFHTMGICIVAHGTLIQDPDIKSPLSGSCLGSLAILSGLVCVYCRLVLNLLDE
ncbi:hypothetical protein DFJ63DRAFT_337084 [Scheffersomyces coipomensis]|uniref:uncharacterized protein n=1 Tax=Scheffersomyces coipomensis TaxID=1788519 RepID=UPI00315CFE94